MPNHFRGIEGPAPLKPQVSNAGERPRPCHLFRTARLNSEQAPTGLTNFTGNAERPGSGPVRGHSYRNAVFQILLNTPMFVNFLRAHHRRCRLYNKGECIIGSGCLACGMVKLVLWYWYPGDKKVVELKIATLNLWKLCLDTFWGHQSPSSQDIGPIDHDEEYHPESFLLYFLTTMQRQLEAIPGEYQTFLSLFTIHTVRRWKCKKCQWASAPDSWEQSLYLPIDIQDLTGRSSSTSIVSGINRGLERRAQALDKNATKESCGQCGGLTKLGVDIVNFPEVLILVRNSEDAQRIRPDIPYDNDELHMKCWTSARNKSEEIRVMTAKQANPDPLNIAYRSYNRDYKLVAGTGELVIDLNRSKSVAFARAALEDTNEWFLINDEEVYRVPSLEQLDKLQRQWDGRGSTIIRNVHPEIFIFRRTDDAGWDYNYHTSTMVPIGPQSASDLDDAARYRDCRGRVATEIFTQQVGQGLLKFKISMAPSDPGANETIPFSLHLSYEYGKHHWNLGEKPACSRLVPVKGNQTEHPRPTPLNDSVVARYLNRTDEHSTEIWPDSTSTDASCGKQPFATSFATDMDIDPSQPARIPFGIDPFAKVADPLRSPDDMDIDVQTHSTFAQLPQIRAADEEIRKRSRIKYLDEYLRDNGFHFGSNDHNHNKNRRSRKGRNNTKRKNNSNNHRNNDNHNDEDDNGPDKQNREGGGRVQKGRGRNREQGRRN